MISYDALKAFNSPVRSPEQLIADEWVYRQSSQMRGFSQAASGDYPQGLGKSCCKSCSHGGPCTVCGGPAGKACRCKGGGSGLGQTTVWGQADLEPGDYGYQYAQTTKPGTTVIGRRQGHVGVDRRQNLTRKIEELEFLAGTSGVHPQALASKVWEARRALMGAGDWSWASYADPRNRYDAREDLESRLAVVERLIGVGHLSPKLMLAHASGAFRGLGGLSGGARWLEPDPIKKLASCIRGAICTPKAFCCPPGTRYRPPPWERRPPPWERRPPPWERRPPPWVDPRDPPPYRDPREGPSYYDPRDTGPKPSYYDPRDTGPSVTTGGAFMTSPDTEYAKLIDSLPQAQKPVTLRPINQGESLDAYKAYVVSLGLPGQHIETALLRAGEDLKVIAERDAQARTQAVAAAAAPKKAVAAWAASAWPTPAQVASRTKGQIKEKVQAYVASRAPATGVRAGQSEIDQIKARAMAASPQVQQYSTPKPVGGAIYASGGYGIAGGTSFTAGLGAAPTMPNLRELQLRLRRARQEIRRRA